ncbi:MAG TPA: hypothetical protein VFT08_05625, partial [Pyrinomonadaceae bacterium]|nr:hypothetical protein [Pyrinomonadaceae bacterium]
MKLVKLILVCGSVVGLVWCASWTNRSLASSSDNDYFGSDACKDCHEDQFKAFSHTSHARLASISSWKDKVTGCEACHGPGKAHLEEGDPAKIISFKNKSPKEISETC